MSSLIIIDGKYLAFDGKYADSSVCPDPDTDEFGNFQYYQTFHGSSSDFQYYCGSCESEHCTPEFGLPCPGECVELECCSEGPNSGEISAGASFHAVGCGRLDFFFSYDVTANTEHIPPCAGFDGGDGFSASCNLLLTKDGSATPIPMIEVATDNMTRVSPSTNEYLTALTNLGSGEVTLTLDFSALDQACKYNIVTSGGVAGLRGTVPAPWSLVSGMDTGLQLVVTAAGCCPAGDSTVIHA